MIRSLIINKYLAKEFLKIVINASLILLCVGFVLSLFPLALYWVFNCEKDFSLVSIRPKVNSFREFNLDKNELKFVNWASWLFLPGIMAMMAAIVWWVRR